MIGYKQVVSSLTNLRLGPEGYRVELKAKVPRVKVRGLWFYNIWSDEKPGYSSGTGGLIRVVVKANGVDLAKCEYRPKKLAGIARLDFGKEIEVAGDITITWENIDSSPEINWASINAMKLVPPSSEEGLTLYCRGKPYPQTDKALIWDFISADGSLLDVGYNYYEVWSKAPKALDEVRQNVGVPLPPFREVWLLTQDAPNTQVVGNSCCIVEGTFGRRVGVVLDYRDDDNFVTVIFEGKYFGTWTKYTFDGPVGGPLPFPWTIRFLCDSHNAPTVWPIRKGVLSFGTAEYLKEPKGGSDGWKGWSYWGKDDLRLSTLPIRFV